tara:strand:+ start:96 stop:647 length:552 start_codon:yes stop_codon:yes gene_type:complete
MAKSKTGAFYLTEQVILTAADTPVQGTLSLASYVDVASKQGIAIEAVDFMYQSKTQNAYNADVGRVGGPTTQMTIGAQVTDVNRGVNIVSAADRALIGSGSLHQAATGGLSHMSDLYPDNYGPVATDEARIVVNDQLFFTAETDNNFSGTGDLAVTVRLKCRIVKLTERDFMAIAITSSAADN